MASRFAQRLVAGFAALAVSVVFAPAFADNDFATEQDNKAQEIAINYLKGAAGGEQAAAEAGVDAAIGIVSMGFPAAGPALGILKGLFLGGGGTTLAQLESRMSQMEGDIKTLTTNLQSLAQQVHRETNIRRLQIISLRRDAVLKTGRRLSEVPEMTPAQKRNFVNDALANANMFIDDGANADLWNWITLDVKGDPKTGKVNVEPKDQFELNTQIELYLQSILILSQAIETTGMSIPAEARQRHIAFLTTNPMGPDGNPVSWPTPLQQRVQPVNCAEIVVAKYSDDDSNCETLISCSGVTSKAVRVPYKVGGPNQLCGSPVGLSGAGDEQQRIEEELARIQEELESGGNGTAAETMVAAAQALEKAGQVQKIFSPSNYGGGHMLFAVDPNGKLLQFEDNITQSNSHSLRFTREIDTGWDQFDKVLTAAWYEDTLVALGIRPDGDMIWKRIENVSAGPVSVTSAPSRIGNGWADTMVLATGQGVLYTVNPSGELIWHRLKWPGTYPPDYSQWAPQNRIGWGWGELLQLFSPGEGIIYAVRSDGTLWWYRHLSYLTGEGLDQGGGHWAEPPQKVGDGWSVFKHLLATDDGRVYGVNREGELMAYHHLGWQTGEYNWEEPVKLADDWGKYLYIFAATGAEPDRGPN